MSHEEKKLPFLWIGIAIAIVAFFSFAFLNKSNKVPGQYLTPISSFRDAHGMAVDVADSSKVYIATHHGLLMMKDDQDLFLVGSGRDDYMGFSVHPTDPNTFFTSGHPVRGGNLGFQKSEDGGRSWQRISSGVNGPVDFHSMAVGQVDPDMIYGTYRGEIQRSLDGGKSWKVLSSSPGGVISLTTDTKDKDVVYAGTAKGLYVSRNQGDDWQVLAKEGISTPTVAVNPQDNKELIVYSINEGLTKTKDGGQSWEPVTISSAPNTPVMFLSFAKDNPSIIYALMQDLSIHKTTNTGESWSKVR